jgi:hypothetical protein
MVLRWIGCSLGRAMGRNGEGVREGGLIYNHHLIELLSLDSLIQEEAGTITVMDEPERTMGMGNYIRHMTTTMTP